MTALLIGFPQPRQKFKHLDDYHDGIKQLLTRVNRSFQSLIRLMLC